MPRYEAVLTLRRPKNDTISFFKFLFPSLKKEGPAQLWMTLGAVVCKNQAALSVWEFEYLI